jgi:hypothetical protein
MAKTKSPNGISKVVERTGPPLVIIPGRLPGHTGPRPQLSFMLKTLAGNDCGMTREHFSAGAPINASNYPGSIELAEAQMLTTMRALADLWIDSGKTKWTDGTTSETPANRNVEYVDDQRPVSISNMFYACYSDGVGLPSLVIHRDGTQSLRRTLFGFDAAEITQWGIESAVKSFGVKIAVHWFAQFLDSPYSRHLMRCDGCKKYFEYQREPKMRMLVRGSYCPRCRKSSKIRMKNIREDQALPFLRIAATAWNQWKSSHNSPDQIDYVLACVNHELKNNGKDLKHRRWVSQNLTKIKEIARGQSERAA